MSEAAIIEIINLALPLAQNALAAIEAAQNGDLDGAKAYLAAARGRFDQASEGLDEALKARAALTGGSPPSGG